MGYLILTPATPPDGLDYEITVPAGHTYKPIAFGFLFTTISAVANRVVRLHISMPSVLAWLSANDLAQAASKAIRYFFILGVGPPEIVPTATSVVRQIAMPELILPEGTVIGTLIDLIQSGTPGDQISQVCIVVEDVTVP